MRGRHDGRAPRGVALILVVWVLTALTVILSEFIFTSRTSVNAARNLKTAAAGYYLALGAFNQALQEIGADYDYLLPGQDGGVFFVRTSEGEPEDLSSTLRSGIMPGTGSFFYRISDEESRMNINRADNRNLTAVLREAGIPLGAERDTIVDSILDWRDNDDLHRLNGAENDYYGSLEPPYRAKNAPFTTIGELLLVKGVTPELFHGSEEYRPLSSLLTVYGDRPNFNTASAAVLEAYVGKTQAEKVMDERESAPFTDLRGQSFHFTVVAGGRPEGAGADRIIKAVVARRAAAKGDVSTRILAWDDSYFEPEAPARGR